MDRLGKYEIRGVLGRGAMGTVYEGYDPVIARRVAIKTVRLPDSADSEEAEQIARFRQEAQAAGRLHHANIVGVFDYAETAELAYIVMEFVEGRTLKVVLESGHKPGLDEIGRLMEGLLSGLAYSHAHAVIHRDIKPANIIVTASGQVKIADFGIARIESSTMTQAGTIMGTPAYMSPEQFQGTGVDTRTDIYSAGVVLFQLLTGRRPFDGSMATIMQAVLNSPAPRPSGFGGNIPPALDEVVVTAMARRAEDRYPDAESFQQALHAALAAPAAPALSPGLGDLLGDEATIVRPAARPAPVEPPPAASPPQARAGGRTRLIAAGAAVVVVAAGVGGWFALSGGRTPTENQLASSTPTPPPSTPSPAPAATPQSQPVPSAAPSPPAPQSPTVHTATSEPPPAPPRPTEQPEPAPAQVAGNPAPETAPPAPKPVTPPASAAPPAPAAPSMTLANREPHAPETSSRPTPPPAPTPQADTRPPSPATPPPSVAAPEPRSAAVAPPQPEAPKPQPQAVAPPPPAATVVTAVAVPLAENTKRAVAAALRGGSCSIASLEEGPNRSLTVRGVVGQGQPEAGLHAAVRDVAPDAPVGWQLATANGPYCGTLDLLRPYAEASNAGRPLDVTLADNRIALTAEELVLPHVAMPGFPAYLQLDYLSSDGSVFHMHESVPGKPYPADANPVFGEPRPPGFKGWAVDQPFGTDLIVAIASAQPLFRAPRPATETPEDYARELRAAVERLTREHDRLSAAILLVRTNPKP